MSTDYGIGCYSFLNLKVENFLIIQTLKNFFLFQNISNCRTPTVSALHFLSPSARKKASIVNVTDDEKSTHIFTCT